MNDLTPDEIDALIRALESDGYIGPCIGKLPVWAAARVDSPDGSHWRLNTPGKLLAKSLKREREAMAWRPIETAPRDGTKVLVFPATWSEQTCSVARFEDDRFAKKPRPFWRRLDDLGQSTRSRDTPPTHWLPLPPPPETER